MKKVLLLLIASLFATTVFAGESPWEKKLPFKSATINYEVSGMMKGEKTLYVKDYGRTSAEYIETSLTMLGMTQPQQEIIITTPDWEYTIDLVENTGIKQANPKKYLIRKFNDLSGSDQKKVSRNIEKLGLSTIEGMNGTLTKNAAKILGYKCDKATILGTVAYTISGTDMPLKIEGNAMGIAVGEVATSISKGSVPSSKFKLPEHISFEHDRQADQMIEAQATTVIQSLLKGKAPAGNALAGPGGGGENAPEMLTPEQQQQLQQMMKIFSGQDG